MAKKLLILGGAELHCKLVEAAHRNQIYTIVIDYLNEDDSPAKKIADKSYQINVTDVSTIVEMCRIEGVDAVLSTHLDPCQIPYSRVCSELNLPCLGTPEQFGFLTNKIKFKELCREHGIDVTEEFLHIDEIAQYPVFVKPTDSRGSRGQRKCSNHQEVVSAIFSAQEESHTSEYIIERFYEGYAEIQATYYFVNGEGYLIRTVDSYKGPSHLQLENVITYGVSPSVYTEEYKKYVNDKVVRMFQSIGIKNGPVMVQGFYKNGKFHIFDQGLRFPGVDYERVYKKIMGVDLLDALVKYSIMGQMPNVKIPEESVYLNGMQFRTIFPLLKSGLISSIEGIAAIKEMPNVHAVLQRKKVGEFIKNTNDIERRLAEIDIVAKTNEEIDIIEKKIYELLSVKDERGDELVIPWREKLS